MAVEYFWDSYAIIEFLKGSPSYAGYAGKPEKITTFNLIEIYWFCLREPACHEAYRSSLAGRAPSASVE